MTVIKEKIHGSGFLLRAAMVVFFAAIFFAPAKSALAEEPASSVELINKAKRLDNQKITYQGELVGSVLNRGNFSWLNLHDGANAIGVWAPAEMTGNVTLGGNYKTRGDVILVEGFFRRACPEHGGALDIHAMSLKVVKSAEPIQEALARKKVFFIVLLLGVLSCLMIIQILQAKFARK